MFCPLVVSLDDPELGPDLTAVHGTVNTYPGTRRSPQNPDDLRAPLAMDQAWAPVLGVCLGPQANAVTMLSSPTKEANEVPVKLLPLRRLLDIADNQNNWLEEWI